MKTLSGKMQKLLGIFSREILGKLVREMFNVVRVSLQ